MISVWGITDKGVVRQQNQDAYVCRTEGEDSAFGIVCDGMGGAKAGDVASRMAVELFQQHIAQRGGGDAGSVLIQAAEAANEAIFQRSNHEIDCNGMGTTLVAAIVEGNTATVANVGDSRAYHIPKGEIRQITKDHSVVEELVAKGSITPEQARCHPQKNLITRALGTSRDVQTDLFQLQLAEGDYLLLCSDGLINEVRDAEILTVIQEKADPEDCCKALLSLALVRGAPDNVTAVLFRL